MVARWAHNPKVAGSSPAPATKRESSISQTLVEDFLCKYNSIYIRTDSNDSADAILNEDVNEEVEGDG